jgi:hypothetical protein
MIYAAITIYWIVAGCAFYMQPSKSGTPSQEFFALMVCMVIGGILVPAKLIAKVIS